jgi:hypothetical protein
MMEYILFHGLLYNNYIYINNTLNSINIYNNIKQYYNNIIHYLCGVNSLFRMNPG